MGEDVRSRVSANVEWHWVNMNTGLWVQKITKNEAPPYPCPQCGKGILVLEKQTLVTHETVASIRAQPDQGWDPDSITYTFSCWLKCAAPRCQGFVAVVGTGGLEAEWDEEHGTIWEDYFRPKSVEPMPEVFPIADDCPSQVAVELRASFRALWSDQGAGASRLRVAVEHLLDEVGVGHRRRTKSGYEALNLHQRIEALSKAQPEVAASLMAIKWLGDTGSHESLVSLTDLLKGYEIMEHAMDTLLGQKAKRAATLARDLSQRHARRRRRKK